jgi:hypothetical protein
MRGFYAEKWGPDHPQRMTKEDRKEPVATFPLGAEEYRLAIAILEQRYPCPARLEDEPRVKLGADV